MTNPEAALASLTPANIVAFLVAHPVVAAAIAASSTTAAVTAAAAAAAAAVPAWRADRHIPNPARRAGAGPLRGFAQWA